MVAPFQCPWPCVKFMGPMTPILIVSAARAGRAMARTRQRAAIIHPAFILFIDFFSFQWVKV
jgi:hypothetical protein